MDNFIDVLACPLTGQSLRWSTDRSALETQDAATRYAVVDGIARMLPADARATAGIQEFYDGAGWLEDDEGHFGDTNRFVDLRPGPFAFTRRCIRRLNRHFAKGGKYLLDAGSGPIPHEDLLDYGRHFGQRICVDLSATALKVARRKLGDRGVYLQGDLTRLPLRTGSIDAITCNHVIYQIPEAADQASAFRELWRVLKPGGVAVVVYWWARAPLEWRLQRVARLLGASRSFDTPDDPGHAAANLVHAPQTREWFEAQAWPFTYRFEPYRVVTNHFMRSYVHDDWRGRLLLAGVSALQTIAPSMCGKDGALPVILISKD